MKLVVKRFITGPIETNTNVLSQDTGASIVFDPSSGCNEVLDYINKEKLFLEAICLTHGHFNHFLGIKEYQGETVYTTG
jgi:glyoxylase-like metal-dependent hydrolase (beta-lactamase superfamily II)